MKVYWLLLAATSAFFLALFGLVELLQLPLLTDPDPWLSRGGMVAAGVGVGLLVADVLLPVPSSLVMVAHGALFGILRGTLLSLAGSLGAAAVGFHLGRLGAPLVARALPEAERRRAEELLARWGGLAVLVTRPVPILAESVAIAAGTTAMRWRQMLAAALAGSVPACLIYAAAGATATGFGGTSLIFGLVLVLAAFTWVVGRRRRRAKGLAEADVAAGSHGL